MVAEAFLPTVGVDEIELINRPTSLIFGIIFTVRTGTLWPHSFATRTAADRPAGSAIGCKAVKIGA